MKMLMVCLGLFFCANLSCMDVEQVTTAAAGITDIDMVDLTELDLDKLFGEPKKFPAVIDFFNGWVTLQNTVFLARLQARHNQIETRLEEIKKLSLPMDEALQQLNYLYKQLVLSNMFFNTVREIYSQR